MPGRSRTAQAVAAERALLDEMGLLSDPQARAMLSPAMAALYRIARRWPRRIPTLPVTLAGLAARVIWHDTQVRVGLDSGLTQVAVIGAGYDTRAWRLARPGVRFFELDHAATQRDKVRRAPSPGPAYVEADLSERSAAEALTAGGFEPCRPSVFVLEGLTMYLSEDVVRHQLRELSGIAPPQSRLSTDFFPPRDAGSAADRRHMRWQRLARTGSGEVVRLLVDGAGAAALVESSGWQVSEVLGARRAARDLVGTDSGLPVDAVNDHKTLLAAVRPS